MLQKYPPIKWALLIFSTFISQHVSTLFRRVYILNWLKQSHNKTIKLKRYQVFNEKLNIYKLVELELGVGALIKNILMKCLSMIWTSLTWQWWFGLITLMLNPLQVINNQPQKWLLMLKVVKSDTKIISLLFYQGSKSKFVIQYVGQRKIVRVFNLFELSSSWIKQL